MVVVEIGICVKMMGVAMALVLLIIQIQRSKEVVPAAVAGHQKHVK